MKIMIKNAVVYLSLIMGVTIHSNVYANEAELAERLSRVERIIKGQGLVSLLGRVDQLQNDLQRAHGENEALKHQIELLKKSQRQMYIDLDTRLTEAQQASNTVAMQISSVENSRGQQKPVQAQVTPSSQEGTQQPTDKKLSSAASPAAVENGEAAYQKALQTLRSGQYEQAITQLTAFPEKYPNSEYLPNAYYWQGETNYVLRQFDLAIDAFQIVIDRFPMSNKVPDALLKKSFSQDELGQTEQAKNNLRLVMQQYPTTSAARLAKVRLARLEKVKL